MIPSTHAGIPATGGEAPDFELPDSMGAARRLSELIGSSALLLLFYRGHWWAFCLRQLAEYGAHADRFRSAGVGLAALSVDDPARSQAVRESLSLSFPILCDTRREVVRTWGLFNEREAGGIAVPGSVGLGPGRRVLFYSPDGLGTRAGPEDALRALQAAAAGAPGAAPKQRMLLPRPWDFLRALRNVITRGR